MNGHGQAGGPGAGLIARRLCANLSFLFPELPFEARFAAAAGAGFRAVEFLFPYDHAPQALARLLAESDLALALFNAPPGDWDAGERGLAALPGREAEFAQGIARALDYAEALGVAQIHVMAGRADPAESQARATYLSNLRLAADRAARRGVSVLVEPINRDDMPGYFLSDFDLAAGLLDDLADSGVALQFDLYHCAMIHGGEAVLPRLEALLPRTRHMQIAGVPGRHEPAEPGLPLRAIFALLDGAGYAGRVGCEYRPAGDTCAGLEWAARLENALEPMA